MLMSGFKEIIQNTSVFSVLRYRNIITFGVLIYTNGTMVGGKRSSSKSKRKKFLILLRITASSYFYVCMEVLQAMAKHFADPAFHTVPHLLDVNCCCHTYSYAIKFCIILM